MGALDHHYCSELAAKHGLPANWEVAIDKFKTPFGRRVVVGVRNKKTGASLTDTAVGNLTKRDLDRHATAMIAKLAKELGHDS
ncbi:MAG: hypothetical protein AAF483_26770 [Planctomycetota bacterium]